MNVYISGDSIIFSSEKVNKLGFTDYNKALWDKVKTMKWNIRFNGKNKKPYIYSSNKGKKVDLHRFVMEHWYGKNEIEKAKKEDFVVDHISNESLDCKISNLCFIPRTLNTSKGNDFDIRRKEVEYIFALNIFKDFRTQLFQITIGFNDPASYIEKNKRIPIAKFFLLYDNNFRRVLYDANNIINELLESKRFDVQKLHCKEYHFEKANFIYLPSDQQNSPMIQVNGQTYLNMSAGTVKIVLVPPYQKLFNKYQEVSKSLK
ncbi:hypothetical protein GFV16_00065 [Bacillus megaterium]|uniref:hypothetical protein n=1 Tax=Priestia megaterium TaxID=1404 RepID=UPI001292F36D|nr:hypothetical protein [Priestia megaterium]MQR84338.1 hypothetical protein [Priestia megaterium]